MRSSHTLNARVRDSHTTNLQIGVVREPAGRVIARVEQEGAVRVLVRRVKPQPHLYRARDAWPLGAHALTQAKDLGVDVLRYIAPDGIYEIALAIFVEQAERLPFAHEPQFVLLRSCWRFTPHAPATVEQLALGFKA